MEVQSVSDQPQDAGNALRTVGLHQKLDEEVTLVVSQVNLVRGQVTESSQLVERNELMIHDHIAHIHRSHTVPGHGLVFSHSFQEPERGQHSSEQNLQGAVGTPEQVPELDSMGDLVQSQTLEAPVATVHRKDDPFFEKFGKATTSFYQSRGDVRRLILFLGRVNEHGNSAVKLNTKIAADTAQVVIIDAGYVKGLLPELLRVDDAEVIALDLLPAVVDIAYLILAE